jgi:hypothetical protein
MTAHCATCSGCLRRMYGRDEYFTLNVKYFPKCSFNATLLSSIMILNLIGRYSSPASCISSPQTDWKQIFLSNGCDNIYSGFHPTSLRPTAKLESSLYGGERSSSIGSMCKINLQIFLPFFLIKTAKVLRTTSKKFRATKSKI